jgi:hypothetical protein
MHSQIMKRASGSVFHSTDKKESKHEKQDTTFPWPGQPTRSTRRFIRE